jgi:hypothetical protein
MRLPNATSAILDIRKITNYCLDGDHPLGRHKARVFRAALGLTIADAGWFRGEILLGVQDAEAVELERIDSACGLASIWCSGDMDAKAVVRTVWIVADSMAAPRFVTCWIP